MSNELEIYEVQCYHNKSNEFKVSPMKFYISPTDQKKIYCESCKTICQKLSEQNRLQLFEFNDVNEIMCSCWKNKHQTENYIKEKNKISHECIICISLKKEKGEDAWCTKEAKIHIKGHSNKQEEKNCTDFIDFLKKKKIYYKNEKQFLNHEFTYRIFNVIIKDKNITDKFFEINQMEKLTNDLNRIIKHNPENFNISEYVTDALHNTLELLSNYSSNFLKKNSFINNEITKIFFDIKFLKNLFNDKLNMQNKKLEDKQYLLQGFLNMVVLQKSNLNYVKALYSDYVNISPLHRLIFKEHINVFYQLFNDDCVESNNFTELLENISSNLKHIVSKKNVVIEDFIKNIFNLYIQLVECLFYYNHDDTKLLEVHINNISEILMYIPNLYVKEKTLLVIIIALNDHEFFKVYKKDSHYAKRFIFNEYRNLFNVVLHENIYKNLSEICQDRELKDINCLIDNKELKKRNEKSINSYKLLDLYIGERDLYIESLSNLPKNLIKNLKYPLSEFEEKTDIEKNITILCTIFNEFFCLETVDFNQKSCTTLEELEENIELECTKLNSLLKKGFSDPNKKINNQICIFKDIFRLLSTINTIYTDNFLNNLKLNEKQTYHYRIANITLQVIHTTVEDNPFLISVLFSQGVFKILFRNLFYIDDNDHFWGDLYFSCYTYFNIWLDTIEKNNCKLNLGYLIDKFPKYELRSRSQSKLPICTQALKCLKYFLKVSTESTYDHCAAYIYYFFKHSTFEFNSLDSDFLKEFKDENLFTLIDLINDLPDCYFNLIRSKFYEPFDEKWVELIKKKNTNLYEDVENYCNIEYDEQLNKSKIIYLWEKFCNNDDYKTISERYYKLNISKENLTEFSGPPLIINVVKELNKKESELQLEFRNAYIKFFIRCTVKVPYSYNFNKKDFDVNIFDSYKENINLIVNTNDVKYDKDDRKELKILKTDSLSFLMHYINLKKKEIKANENIVENTEENKEEENIGENNKENTRENKEEENFEENVEEIYQFPKLMFTNIDKEYYEYLKNELQLIFHKENDDTDLSNVKNNRYFLFKDFVYVHSCNSKMNYCKDECIFESRVLTQSEYINIIIQTKSYTFIYNFDNIIEEMRKFPIYFRILREDKKRELNHKSVISLIKELIIDPACLIINKMITYKNTIPNRTKYYIYVIYLILHKSAEFIHINKNYIKDENKFFSEKLEEWLKKRQLNDFIKYKENMEYINEFVKLITSNMDEHPQVLDENLDQIGKFINDYINEKNNNSQFMRILKNDKVENGNLAVKIVKRAINMLYFEKVFKMEASETDDYITRLISPIHSKHLEKFNELFNYNPIFFQKEIFNWISEEITTLQNPGKSYLERLSDSKPTVPNLLQLIGYDMTERIPFFSDFIFYEFNSITPNKNNSFIVFYKRIFEFLKLLCINSNLFFTTIVSQLNISKDLNMMKYIYNMIISMLHNIKNFSDKETIFKNLCLSSDKKNDNDYKYNFFNLFFEIYFSIMHEFIISRSTIVFDINDHTLDKFIKHSVDYLKNMPYDETFYNYLNYFFKFLKSLTAENEIDLSETISKNHINLVLTTLYMKLIYITRNVYKNKKMNNELNNHDDKIYEFNSHKILIKELYITPDIFDNLYYKMITNFYIFINNIASYDHTGLSAKFLECLRISSKEEMDLNIYSNSKSNNKTEGEKNLLLLREIYLFLQHFVRNVEIIQQKKLSTTYKEEDVKNIFNFIRDRKVKKLSENNNNENSSGNDENLKYLCLTTNIVENHDKHNELNIVRKFFVVHPYIKYKNIDEMKLFKKDIDISYNYSQKLYSLFNYSTYLNKRVQLSKNSKLATIQKHFNTKSIEKISICITVFLNFMLLFILYKNQKFKNDSKLIYPFYFISIIHSLFLGLFILTTSLNNKSWEQKMKLNQKNSNENSTLENEDSYLNDDSEDLNESNNKFEGPSFFIIHWNFIFGLLAIINWRFNFFYSIQMFSIITLFPIMKSVIISVKEKIYSFLSILFLMIIFLLFFTMYDLVKKSDNINNREEVNSCDSLLQCFLNLFYFGVRAGAGMGYSLKVISDPNYFNDFFVEWAFYFFIILIILNVMNGVVVDTFQYLRERNSKQIELDDNSCFICSLKRSEFEYRGIQLSDHIEYEHNIENYHLYIYYIKYTTIKSIKKEKFSSCDYEIENKIKKGEIDFFPIQKSYRLNFK